MWSIFFSCFLFASLLLYLPGLIGSRLAGFSDAVSLATAPFLSAFALAVSSFLFRALGITGCWWGLILVSVVFMAGASCLVGFLCRKSGVSLSRDSSLGIDWKICFLYLAISLIVSGLFFVKTLDGAGSIYQENDNIFHLTTVRDFVDSGIYCLPSPLSYPALWHTIASLVSSFCGGNVPVAVNAVNLTLISVVCPLSVMALLMVVFEDRKVVIAGSVCSLAVAGFPWGFLLFGPLYPNLLGYSLFLGVAAVFILALKTSSSASRRGLFILFVLGCFTLLLAHPNAVFVGVVLLSPYCVSRIMDSGIRLGRFGTRVSGIVLSVSFVVVVLLIWTVLYLSPFFSGVVSFKWPSYLDAGQAFCNLASLSYTKASVPQLALSVLVILGIFALTGKRKNRWLICSYLLFASFWFVCATSDGFLRHFLAGFWYTDEFRVAAAMSIVATLLSSVGLAYSVDGLAKFLTAEKSPLPAGFTAAVLAAVAILVFLPNHNVPKGSYITTGFGQVSSMLDGGNSLATNEAALDSEEISFANKVREVVGDNKLFNVPYDGSAYLYAVSDLNVENRAWYGYKDDSSMDSIIRNGFDSVSSNREVSDAVKAEGVRYLILLDNKMGDGAGGVFEGGYVPGQWSHVLSIDENTPGFRLIMAEDDMRLFEIIQ